jgi:DNA-binding transcriptional LysR family regulator
VHGSVAAAAGALHLTPPAVSQQLMVLERETGASLIDRSGKQVALTAAGRLLAAHGERIAAQLRQAERDLAELTGQAGQRHDPAGQEGHDFLGARWRAVAQD